MGLGAIWLTFRFVVTRRLWVFSLYLIVAGTFIIAYNTCKYMAKFLIISNAIYRDVIGLFLLALSIFLGISLLSFHSADPTASAGKSAGAVLN